MRLQNPVPYLAAQPVEPAGTSIGERIVSTLIDVLDLLGSKLGGAVLMQQSWINAGAVLAPLGAARDDA